jgi:predicted aldo/keto reductase-like oxidoreductase
VIVAIGIPTRPSYKGVMLVPSFMRRQVPALGREVFRLGLACNYGVDERGFDRALERGVEYVFWTRLRTGGVQPALKRALAMRRDRVVLGAGPGVGYFGGGVRRAAERLLRDLGTDCIDVFHLFWVGRTSALTEGTLQAMADLKAEGKIRAFAVSIHDRKRAGELVKSSPIEWFMLRYNAAHPGAERDVFPNLESAPHKPAVCAYTATSWRKLLRKPRGWTGEPMSAGDCYRFCLSSPHVDLSLMGPSSIAQVDANLDALEKGPLSADEDAWMREFGRVVHG